MQYKVVSIRDKYMKNAVERVEQQVKLLIKAGWKPLGGISITKDDIFYACQTMVK